MKNLTSEGLQTVEARVRKILEMEPATRSSDRLLQELYLRYWHGITSFQEQTESEESPSTESIRRLRQKIQSQGDYPADPEVMEMRTSRVDLYMEYLHREVFH